MLWLLVLFAMWLMLWILAAYVLWGGGWLVWQAFKLFHRAMRFVTTLF